MQLLWLEYFKTIADCGSLSKAANKLYISPPALSETLKKLEIELGVRLFDRRSNRFIINECGIMLLPYVNMALNSINEGIERTQSLQVSKNQNLAIAITSTMIWDNFMHDFNKACPDIKISYVLLTVPNLLDNDLLHRFDFIITSPCDFIASKNYESMVLYDDDYPVLLVNKKHPLAKREKIDLSEASGETFIALYNNLSSRLFFDNLCKQAGFEPKIAVECDYTMRTYMVSQNAGVAISTIRSVKAFPQKNIVPVKIVKPEVKRSQVLYCLSGKCKTAVTEGFKKYAYDYFHNGR